MSAPFAPGEDGTRVDADRLFAMRHLVRHLPERDLAPTGRPGGFAGHRRGNGLEIVDVRLFEEGDDARHLDAATTARTGKRHVRTFRDERDKAAFFVADFRRPMLWGTRRRFRSVAGAGALALAGWRVIEAGGRVGLMTVGADMTIHLRARGRERAMASVSAALAEAHEAAWRAAANDAAVAEPTLDRVLDHALGNAARGSTIVIATGLDAPGPDFDALVSGARRRARIRVLLVRDAFEREAPRGAYPFVTESAGERLKWAFVARDPSKRDETATQGLADHRTERLRSLGVEVRVVDANAEWTTIATGLEFADGR